MTPLAGYVSLSAGMALAASCYMVLGLLAGSNTYFGMILAIVVAAALCAAVALAVGELASRFPSSPGIRVYTKRALGEVPSLFFTYLAIVIIALFSGIEFKVFTTALLPQALPLERLLSALAVIAAVACLNLRGFDLSRRTQMVIFTLLIVGSLLMSAMALSVAVPTSASPASGVTSQGSTFVASVGTAFFLFAGFEWVTPTARTPTDARRLVPISMITAIGVLAVTYLMFALALKRVLSAGELLHGVTPHVLLAARLLGNLGTCLMQAVSLLALATTVNAGLLGTSRLLYSLARERALIGGLVRPLSFLNSRDVPAGSLLFLAAVSAVSAGIEIYCSVADSVAQICAGLYCCVYCAFTASHIRVRRSASTAAPFTSAVPLACYYVLAPALGIVGLLTIVGSPQELASRLTLLVLMLCACGWAAIRVARSRHQVVSG